ncbi:MAG TPA: type II toxin-antitoxin system VapC family toxin [Ktedonobacteraceae bacterium]|nr:type II toxin-antitoxin system VapC family toxin [Ktedonobacteraceae bacterium]
MDAIVVVDATVWVSRWMPREINHDVSRQWVERYAGEGGIFVAPAFILIEVAAAIARGTGDPQLARTVIRDLCFYNAVRILSLKDELMWDAVDVAVSLQLRAGDAAYVAVARRHNIPLVSWDKEQLRKASSLTTTYTPDEYPF